MLKYAKISGKVFFFKFILWYYKLNLFNDYEYFKTLGISYLRLLEKNSRKKYSL